MGWVKKEVVNSDIIIAEIKNKITKEHILNQSARNEEKPYGYLCDMIKDNYFVTLKQCDYIAKRVLEHYNITY